jgi:hypothetical protein
VITLVLAILIAGLVPPVWNLPGLKLVQFPWRALLLVEFAAVTMLAIAPPRLRSFEGLGGALLAVFAYSVLLLMIGHTVSRTWAGQRETAAQIRLRYLDAPEYLPAGTRIVQGSGPDDVSFDLPKVPLASSTDAGAAIRASDLSNGGMIVRVASPQPTVISLHRFYFPNWQLRDGGGRIVPVERDPTQKIVTFRAPAGRSIFRLEPGTAPYEVPARIISLIAILACAAMAWVKRNERLTASPSG